eukprot:5202994-Prymnesium_polylepis.2
MGRGVPGRSALGRRHERHTSEGADPNHPGGLAARRSRRGARSADRNAPRLHLAHVASDGLTG